MDWQDRLIGLYVYICQHYKTHLWVHAQRLSNNNRPKFTDEEVLTLYLFGIWQKHTTIKDIYTYTQDHLFDWFPDLPTYQGYVQRLNNLAPTFCPLVAQIVADCPIFDCFSDTYLVDSFPCVIANAKRSGKARVARQIASKGFCASKGMWYYGTKVHIVAKRTYNGLPIPDYISLTGAADHDLSALRPLLPYLHNGTVYGDKIYANKTLKDTLLQQQNLAFYTPVKKKKGQNRLPAADQVLSRTVSRTRQPIESLFGWIEDKTGIQTACKVRSYNGLIVHIFGRLAAACFLLAFYS